MLTKETFLFVLDCLGFQVNGNEFTGHTLRGPVMGTFLTVDRTFQVICQGNHYYSLYGFGADYLDRQRVIEVHDTCIILQFADGRWFSVPMKDRELASLCLQCLVDSSLDGVLLDLLRDRGEILDDSPGLWNPRSTK